MKWINKIEKRTRDLQIAYALKEQRCNQSAQTIKYAQDLADEYYKLEATNL